MKRLLCLTALVQTLDEALPTLARRPEPLVVEVVWRRTTKEESDDRDRTTRAAATAHRWAVDRGELRELLRAHRPVHGRARRDGGGGQARRRACRRGRG